MVTGLNFRVIMKYSALSLLLGLCVTTATPSFAVSKYGPTAEKETLWSIASRLRPSKDTSVQQVMLALYRENPKAFVGHNINALKKGVYLRIPNFSQMRKTSKHSAVLATQRQNRVWSGKASTKQKQTTRTKVARSSKRTSQLKQRLQRLETSLNKAHKRNRKLEAELKKTKAIQVASTAPVSLASLQNQKALEHQKQFNIEIAKKVQTLTAELDVLKSVIAEKDEHIRNLKTSLKLASETIKRQHKENERIYAALQKAQSTQVASAEQAPSTTQTDAITKPQLKLTPLQVTPAEVTVDKSKTEDAQLWANKAQKEQTTNNNLVEQQSTNQGSLTLAAVDEKTMQASNGVKPINQAPVLTTPAVAENTNGEAISFKPTATTAESEKGLFGLPEPSKSTIAIAAIALLGALGWLIFSVFGRKKNTSKNEIYAAEAKRRNHINLEAMGKKEPSVEGA